MARQDISMDAILGEVKTTDNLIGKTVWTFSLLQEQPGEDNDNILFGEVILTPVFASQCKDGTEIHVFIPYIADSREIKLRLRVDGGSGMPEYKLNPATNRLWYPIVWNGNSGTHVPVKMSEMWKYNTKGNFSLVIQGGTLELYSGDDTDLTIGPALVQNEAFLLKAFAGNLYQHPLTGVGLIEYLHGNFENTGLATKLQKEFTNDGMLIHNAYMNSETGELNLEVTEKNG